MLSAKTKKILAIIYVAVMLLGGLYVYSVVTDKSIKVEPKEEEKKGMEVKPVNVSLTVIDGNSRQPFTAKMQNIDSVLDLLEYIRNKQGLRFDKIAYINGTEIDNVSGIKAPKGYMWKVFEGVTNITTDIADTKLKDGQSYTLKLEKL